MEDKFLPNRSYTDIHKVHINLMAFYREDAGREYKVYQPLLTFRLEDDSVQDAHLQSFYLQTEFEHPKEAALQTARLVLQLWKRVGPTVHVIGPEGTVDAVYNVESLYAEQVAVMELAEILRTNKLKVH